MGRTKKIFVWEWATIRQLDLIHSLMNQDSGNPEQAEQLLRGYGCPADMLEMLSKQEACHLIERLLRKLVQRIKPYAPNPESFFRDDQGKTMPSAKQVGAIRRHFVEMRWSRANISDYLKKRHKLGLSDLRKLDRQAAQNINAGLIEYRTRR